MRTPFLAFLIPILLLIGCKYESTRHIADLRQFEVWPGILEQKSQTLYIAAPTEENPDCPEITLTTKNLNGAGMVFALDNLDGKLVWSDYPDSADKTTLYIHNKSDKWSCVVGLTLSIYEKDQIIPDAPHPDRP